MAQLSSDTVGLNLNAQVMDVPQLGMLGMQLDEMAEKKKAEKQAAVQKLVGDFDTSLVHPKYQKDLNDKISNLYQIGYRAYSTKDPEAMAQFQEAKRQLSIYAGHAKLAGDAFRKQQLDVTTNRSNYNIDDAGIKSLFEQATTPVKIDDISTLDIANDVLQLPTKVQTTGMGIYELASKEAADFKDNFVDPNTGAITQLSRSKGTDGKKATLEQFTEARYNSWYNTSKGEDKERLLRDYWLASAQREGETWDERKETALRNEYAQDPEGYEQKAKQYGLDRFREQIAASITAGKAPVREGGSSSSKNKFSNFGVVEYESVAGLAQALPSGADEKVKKQIQKLKITGPVFHAPLGDNKIQVGNKLYSDVIYGASGNEVAYIAYKADPKLLEQLGSDNPETRQSAMLMITSENKIPEVIPATASTNREFANSFNAEDWSVYKARVNASFK